MDFTLSFLQLFYQILQVVASTVLLLVSLIVVLGQILRGKMLKSRPPYRSSAWIGEMRIYDCFSFSSAFSVISLNRLIARDAIGSKSGCLSTSGMAWLASL